MLFTKAISDNKTRNCLKKNLSKINGCHDLKGLSSSSAKSLNVLIKMTLVF